MLAEIESSLVDYLAQSSIAAHLRKIDVLPDVEGDTLIGRLNTDAPAIYLSLGAGAFTSPGWAEIAVALAIVTRSTRGPRPGRQGDGVNPGLLELMSSAITLLDGQTIAGRTYQAVGWKPLASDALSARGLYGAVFEITTEVAFSRIAGAGAC